MKTTEQKNIEKFNLLVKEVKNRYVLLSDSGEHIIFWFGVGENGNIGIEVHVEKYLFDKRWLVTKITVSENEEFHKYINPDTFTRRFEEVMGYYPSTTIGKFSTLSELIHVGSEDHGRFKTVQEAMDEFGTRYLEKA